MHQLEFVWFGTDLPCRPSRSTYDLYQQVPFIPEDKTRDLQFLDHSQVEQSQELALLEKLDQSLLPKELIMILSNASLQRQVPSCTACYFDLEEPFVVKALQTTLLLFYRDQQDCLLWYYAMDGPKK
ncbi:hypothetical protein EDD86DRAFT_244130 [Gorgonomyces haynaldii]|nr:hypothetical protein EDD86DRAFT_244130 [Gorgonomyces haynaldii]